MVSAGMPEGSGTEADPYLITTAKELDTMRKLSDTRSPKYFKIVQTILTCPIMQILGRPIGNSSQEFGGIVDGNGKTIRGRLRMTKRMRCMLVCLLISEIPLSKI